jgi:cyclic pyranopterin phosphate synthase
MSKLTHLNETGEVHMVDVGSKPATRRVAMAEGLIRMSAQTLELIQSRSHRKGDVLAVARVAGIMAAKRTAELVPLCHAIPLTAIEIDLEPAADQPAIRCRVRAETLAQTGVEMEALTGVQVALLTIYDMCKSADRGMTIDGVRLLEKSGGRSGDWKRK